MDVEECTSTAISTTEATWHADRSGTSTGDQALPTLTCNQSVLKAVEKHGARSAVAIPGDPEHVLWMMKQIIFSILGQPPFQ